MTAAAPPPALPDDLKEVRQMLVEAAERGQIDVVISAILALLEQTREKNNQLQQQLAFALRQLYGRKSQAVSKAQLELSLEQAGLGSSSEGEELVPQPPLPGDDEEKKDKPKNGHNKGKKRRPFPDHLARIYTRVPLADEHRPCPHCKQPRVTTGWRDSSPVLEFVPAHFELHIEQRETVVCKHCAADEDKPEIHMDRADTEKMVPGGIPGPGLLAQLVVDKLDNAMPLERQAKDYARLGVDLPTSTMGDWAAHALDCLVPLYDTAVVELKTRPVMNVDDTHLLALDKKHPKHVHKGHLWVHVAGDLAVFHYTLTWDATEFSKFLGDYAGLVQGDGYRGFEAKLESDDEDAIERVVPEERRLGCLMHLRAKFEKAYQGGEPHAALPLSLIKKIYDVEKQAKELSVGLPGTPPGRLYLPKPVDPELRLRMRKAESLGWWRELRAFVAERLPKTRPKSDMARALTYATNQGDRIERCFLDGRLELDNGVAERVIKLICIGRKNYMFAGSPAAGQRLAVGYTLVATARMHGLDPYAYLRDVLVRLRRGVKQRELRDLLPDRWATKTNAVQTDARPASPADG